jgi:hypothetical protein
MAAQRIAADPNVIKYGRSMRGVRWETVSGQFRASRNYIAPEGLEDIYQFLFEPTATRMGFQALGPAFFDFLDISFSRDDEAGKILRECAAPFARDLLRFERAQMRFRPSAGWPSVPSGSRLVHSRFCLIDLEYDVPAFLLKMSEVGAEAMAEAAPELRPMTVLFLPREDEPGTCRYFEIDRALGASISACLNGELTGLSGTGLPTYYADLVGLGICREEN